MKFFLVDVEVLTMKSASSNRSGRRAPGPAICEETRATQWSPGPAAKWVLCGSGLDSKLKVNDCEHSCFLSHGKNLSRGHTSSSGSVGLITYSDTILVLHLTEIYEVLQVQVASFATLTGATVVTQWSSAVTHVITWTDEQGAAKRTLKYLLAMLEGKWIVRIDCNTLSYVCL